MISMLNQINGPYITILSYLYIEKIGVTKEEEHDGTVRRAILADTIKNVQKFTSRSGVARRRSMVAQKKEKGRLRCLCRMGQRLVNLRQRRIL